ncbi:transcription-repair coupling factor [Candidatus Sumerlaeota bacterium]|nr:transcription-repair coupling factor [Candidatus Sumerlaeota bacterium]
MNKLQKILFDEISRSADFSLLYDQIASGRENVVISSLMGSSLAIVASALSAKLHRTLCLVTSKRERSEEIYDDLEYFGCASIFHFPAWEILPYEPEEPHLEIAAKQLDACSALLRFQKEDKEFRDNPPVIVAPVDALFQKVLSLEFFSSQSLEITWGEKIETELLAARLVDIGYTRTSMVEIRGEFSIRGGIIDIFPLTLDDPARIDLFGKEIESIRFFDPSTQRSYTQYDSIDKIMIPPARLSLMIHQSVKQGVPLATFFQCLPDDAILILDEPAAFREIERHFEELVEREYFEVSAKGGDHIPPDQLYTDWEELEKCSRQFLTISHSALPVFDSRKPDAIRFTTGSFHEVTPSLDYYIDLVSRKQKEGFLVNVACDNEGQLRRFDEILREREISAVEYHPEKENAAWISESPKEGALRDVVLSIGNLHEGFIIPGARLLLITDREIFGRYKRRHIYRKIYKGAAYASASEIKRGDHVVHEEHGIGEFLGIRTQIVDNKKQDFIELLYADNAKLLVPVDRIHAIQRYSLVENAQPPLDELGSKQWIARKKKTQERIENMAKELLTLYAKRELATRRAFNPDTVWQNEFESSFIYEETPDQLTAIHQVKRDLESDKPMDRLVCGDVGYGKTEVAIRATFKVVQEGKQVAVLAPTTILCQQHFNTFSERFREYPFNVEMLSRFRTSSEQKKILQRVKDGDVHVIVGTHRLLSKDVVFLDLGLVVVDEEQRFGVTHKERLKELRASVDFMTLTATPIPRTLYMALSGLRDLSIINTPPPNRLPIRTKIIHWDDELIREAIMRELNRGGQIYFVHNRVQNIDHISQRLKEIAPDLKICIGHGQMNEHELEQVMIDFISQKYDLLLSTTIIENGLDIPNVNTIVINRADAFGLAQLYQLRGRVGRDVKRAYAYLITPSGEAITDAAVRRLAAIEEFTELGVGFNVAMRDLEIRGSGNLLGKEQHGCIVSIGFDLYCSLLDKTVKRLKGEEVEPDRFVEIKWSIESHLSSEYVPVESQRMGLYKRLSETRRVEEVKAIREEMLDRYGDPPIAAENLLKIVELRILASRLGLTRITLTPNGYKVTSGEKNIAAISDALHASRKELGEPLKIDVEDKDTLHVRYLKWHEQPQLDKALQLFGKTDNPQNMRDAGS